MFTDIYYFELRESRTGRFRLEFMGSAEDLQATLTVDELDSGYYRANDIGISIESIHTYMAVSDDFYSHIGVYGHHENEDELAPEAWSEEKKKYENMRHIRKIIEDEWQEIAQTVGDRPSRASIAVTSLNDVEF
jgi:hypothetical protein